MRAEWDPEAGVYVATSEDVPGLVAEAGTVADLTRKLEVLVPELLELNASGEAASDRHWVDVPMMVLAEQITKVRICA